MTVAPSQRRGLLRPFGRDQKAGFATDSGAPLVEGRVGAIVASAGEVPWKPGLDAGLNRLRNVRSNGSLSSFTQVYVSTALRLFEPALTNISSTATRSDRATTVLVKAELDGASVNKSQSLT